MNRILLLLTLLISAANSFSQTTSPQVLTKISFGSCINQNEEQPIWEAIIEQQPQLFIFAGDNLYGDTEDMELLQLKYKQLAAKPGFAKLRSSIPIIATWDDHDYGINDGGKEYPKKEESKKHFLTFWNEPLSSERWQHEGIFTSYMYGTEGQKLQIIVLDTRSFRDKLCLKRKPGLLHGEYEKCTDTTKQMLGEDQWKWLEQELRKPADLRLIVSSTQFLVDFNGWEAWVNMPHERERFFQLIERTKANGLFFISGDVHYAEFSKLSRPRLYPIYDFTSSGMTHSLPVAGRNKNRIKHFFGGKNFGTISIDWSAQNMLWEIRNIKGKSVRKHSVSFDELKF
jgi:alkaline phosphatase D